MGEAHRSLPQNTRLGRRTRFFNGLPGNLGSVDAELLDPRLVMLLTTTLAQATRRIRPDDPLARGSLDVPSWVVVLVAVVLTLGVALVLLHRARKR